MLMNKAENKQGTLRYYDRKVPCFISEIKRYREILN
jgi:hypothetical protein